MKYLYYFVLLFLFATLPLLAEPSVFGFETQRSNTDQGTISVRDLALKNHREITRLKQTLRMQQEKIDGLTSIIEGLSASLGELQAGGVEITEEGGTGDRALLEELGRMIDEINSNYVSREALRKILGEKPKPALPKVKQEALPEAEYLLPQKLEEKSEPVEREKVLTPSELYSMGRALFEKKRYSEAEKRFRLTDTKGYKPAGSNYYLGEIAYYTKQYKDAVFHFKKSAGLNDRASYIDVLLLHTGISLEKTGEKEQAKIFYENIITNYGDRKSAQIAKKKLKRL